MTGPTGADQRRPGDLTEDDIVDMAAEIRYQTATRRAAAHRTARPDGEDHPDSPPTGR